jgi:hypothetical protein
MLGVPRNLIEHSLNVDPKAAPKRQHLRRSAADRQDAINKELAKLLVAGFIREVFHPEWLANPVLVRKKNSNEWRMCVDCTDLNKHCPNDPFGLPRIDQGIDSMVDCDLLYRWKLNPNKCVFGVPSGKLLGFIISHRGIEANLEKISTITNMRAPNCIKDVQKLTGRMVAFNKFISKLGEWGLPFFKLLKHQEKFVWTPEADQALTQLKDFLSKPPVLTAHRKKEQLLLYLAATTHVVSSAIVVERQEDGHTYPVQQPVYFISEVLLESKARYQPVQKLLYAVLITLWKLRHYFQKYSVSSSLTSRLATSCGTKMLLEESPSGQ